MRSKVSILRRPFSDMESCFLSGNFNKNILIALLQFKQQHVGLDLTYWSALAKLGFTQERKVWSQISLCSIHRLIRDDTFLAISFRLQFHLEKTSSNKKKSIKAKSVVIY